jgi:hypothetical protein
MRKSIAVLVVLAAAVAPPARADILGTIVNKVMETVLYGLNAPPSQAPATQDQRPIPEDALSGTMSPPQGREVTIDGQDLMLAPGCRIRDISNRIVQPVSVRAPVQVRYELNPSHEVQRVWLLAGL